MDETSPAVSEDRVLGGRVILRQPARGYRAGLDAALLAAACDAAPGEREIDDGCGVGAVMLATAARRPGVHFVGIERDPVAVALARENAAANGFADRVEVLQADVTTPSPAQFDAALCNPPYFDDARAIRGPHPAKRSAFLAEGGLGAWAQFLLAAVRDGGTITLVHRPDRLADILALLGTKAGSFQVRPVHPFVDEPAGRVLVRAVRGGRAPLRLLPALVAHARGHPGHTAETEAILRGAAALPWL